MNIKVTIDASDFQKFLKDSPRAFEKALQNAIQKGAYLIERISKQNAPVDTGRLRSSIATSLIPFRATIEPHVNYAVFVHEGTRFISARPFMFDAAEQADREISDILSDEVRKVLT